MKSRTLFSLALMILLGAAVIIALGLKPGPAGSPFEVSEDEHISALGVCPPFYLLTQEGPGVRRPRFTGIFPTRTMNLKYRSI